MDYLGRFKNLKVETINFISPNPRRLLPKDEDDEETINRNNNFPIELIIPDDNRRSKKKNAMIIINGFNEPSRNAIKMYYSAKFGICQLLREHGISSVLLPIPFHYCRRPIKGAYQNDAYTPAHSIDKERIKFYLGYKQLVLDIRELALHLLGKGNLFEVPCTFDKIHLMGFSLGGLGALTSFILDQKHGENNITTSTMLFSGSSLIHVNPRGLAIEQSQVDALVDYYESGSYRNPEFSNIIGWNDEEKASRLNAFRYLVLNKKSEEKDIADVLAGLMKRVPIIIGQADRINPSGFAKTFVPPDAEHDLSHTEPGVGHFLWRDRKWMGGGAKNSIKWLMNIVEKFL